MLTAQEAFLESTLQKIARIMTKRSGVKVSIRGHQAYIDMETLEIVLPSLSSRAVTDLGLDLDGCLDHEDAHAMYTDAAVLATMKPNEKELHYIHNSLEDIRIEALKSAAYRGCAENLARIRTAVFKANEAAWEKTDALGKLSHALQKCWKGDTDVKAWESELTIGALMQELKDEVEDGRRCASTKDALDVATRVVAKIKKLSEESGASQDPQGGKDAAGEADASTEQQRGKSQSPENSAPDKQDGSESGGMPGDDADGDGSDTDDSGDADGGDSTGDGAGDDAEGSDGASGGAANKNDGEAPSGSRGSAPQSSGKKDADKEAVEQAKQFQKRIGSYEKPRDVESFINDHIMEFLDKDDTYDPSEYLIFCEERDTDHEYKVDERLKYAPLYAKLKNKVQPMIGTMATHLELSLAAQTEARWVGGEKRGRHFDRRRFASWVEGSNDDRIFRVKHEGERLDTAITLLWDCSGSMGSSDYEASKAALARLSAIAFHEALVRCQIPHEVLGFNTGGGTDPVLRRMAEKAEARGDNLRRYCRVDELNNHMVFVPYGQQDGRAICAITGGSSNRDGEAVLWASKRLAARPEKRKILIVGSDGHPAGTGYHRTECDYLRGVVQRAIAAGLEVYGIGIMDDSVKDFYPTYVVINHAEELPRVVMGQLSHALIGQKGRTNNAVSGRGSSKRSA
jgi:cobalamin biosynthesis protein CobT